MTVLVLTVFKCNKLHQVTCMVEAALCCGTVSLSEQVPCMKWMEKWKRFSKLTSSQQRDASRLDPNPHQNRVWVDKPGWALQHTQVDSVCRKPGVSHNKLLGGKQCSQWTVSDTKNPKIKSHKKHHKVNNWENQEQTLHFDESHHQIHQHTWICWSVLRLLWFKKELWAGGNSVFGPLRFQLCDAVFTASGFWTALLLKCCRNKATRHWLSSWTSSRLLL